MHSTETSVDRIHRPAPKPSITEATAARPTAGRQLRAALRLPALRTRKPMVLGVEIGHTDIRIAKTARLADKRYQLIDYCRVPLQGRPARHDPLFRKQLQAALERIGANEGHCEIWSAIPSARVELRCLRVPKLKKRQLTNAVHWTFTTKVALNEQEELLDFDILGDITEEGVRKTEVLAFKAPKAEVAALKEAFEAIGYPLTGISIVPFAVQNLFRTGWLRHGQQDACTLFVGRDWSRIAIYNQNHLVLARGIKTGMRSMVEAIQTATTATPSDGASDNGTIAFPSETDAPPGPTTVPEGIAGPAAQQCFFDFLLGKDASAEDQQATSSLGHPPEAVFAMLRPALDRLVRQVERTFAHYSLHFQGGKVKRLLLSGRISANDMLIEHIAKQLDLPTEVMNPFAADPAFIGDAVVPEGRADRESYLPAIGLAVSHNSFTPNFLHTHKDKAAEDHSQRFNHRLLAGCLACLLALLMLFAWQERRISQKRETIARLDRQLLTYTPAAEKEIMLALFAQSRQRRQTMTQLVESYLPVAMLQELSRLTPPNVRLIDVTADLEPSAGQQTSNAARVTVDGLVFGAPGAFETALTSYLLTLRNSPIFSRPVVQNRRVEYYDGREVLRFQAVLEIEG
ncbi:pilus assembly protein PilM [Desulfatitalea alkaliphila]|uniref:Pilus assembly protein PilM n=1 Tax=Desulfatitalea alkaliphila TaxID=2929485 RepID=A0AA41R6D2_9BACT|nr:pilus assembly protein PilM [Desulfatitalea alkaliphila]MCJ8501985.1 pilus assembly protein PilM [Desulfatitalea alkaliphila]